VTKSVFTRRYKKFLALLIEARERQGLSQHQLAKKLKKPQSYVSKYERGERRLDVIEFLDLSYILEVDACELIRKVGC
jgi:transcriptional regulator with XRE-family HTH domain